MSKAGGQARVSEGAGALASALRWAPLALLLVWAFALRLPTLGSPNFLPDAAEYTGMARRLAEGQGLTTALKWHFYDNAPVVRPAVIERPVLYPLFAGLVLRLAHGGDSLMTLQTANALLSVANVGIALAAYRTVVAPGPALLAAALLALSPPMTQTATAALSEQLFLFFWLAGLLLLPRLPRTGSAAAFGAVAALATLTRINGVLLLLAPLALGDMRERRKVLAAWGALGAAFALLIAPWLLHSAAAQAEGFRSGALVNFSVLRIHEASWHGFGREIAGPLEFIRAQPGAVAGAILAKTRSNLAALLLSLGPLVLLGALAGRGGFSTGHARLRQVWLGGCRRAEPRRWTVLRTACPPSRAKVGAHEGGRVIEGHRASRLRSGQSPTMPLPHRSGHSPWLLLALANFLFYSLSWVAVGGPRYLLPTTALLLPFLVHWGVMAARERQAGRFLAAVVLAWTLVVMGGYWQAHRQACAYGARPALREPYRTAARWLEEAAGPDDVVASNNPWMIYYLTRRPSLACPHFRPEAGLDLLARRFQVRWVVLFAREGEPRLMHCRAYPGARLIRQSCTPGRMGIYLFAVQPGTE